MLNQAPYEWNIEMLEKRMKEGPHAEIWPYRWQVARPFGMYSLRSRLRLAWAVFTGRADALFWPHQNPKAY
jgi:hypothetical protein